MSTSEFEPPSEVIARRRWIKPERVEWALDADAILREHGSVRGTTVYSYNQARWRVRKLRDLLIDLELYEAPELTEHVNKAPPQMGNGYIWALEYTGRGPINGRR